MKVKQPGQRPRRERGNVTLEAAIALPLLLLIAAGIIDLGMLFWEQQVLSNATREGARAGSRAAVAGAYEYTKSTVMTSVVQPYLRNNNIRDASGSLITLTLGGNFTYTVDTAVNPNRLTIRLVNIPVRMMLLPNIQTLFDAGAMDQTVNLNAQTTMAAEWITAPP